MLATVTFSDGSRGHVEVPLRRAEMADVRLNDGRSVRIPADLLMERGPSDYAVPAAPPKAEDSYADRDGAADAGRDLDLTGSAERAAADSANVREDIDTAEKTVIPVIAETARVEKRAVETGRVRVTKSVSEREEVIDEPLLRQEVEVTRTAVGRMFAEAPAVRYEGETVVVPVIEEVLVVEKRYLVKEEVRIARRAVETHQPQRVTLRTEDVNVERVPADGSRRERA